jgi:LPS-assembly lipoprotein
MWSAKTLVAPLLLCLAGCGFTPVYGDHSTGTAFVDDDLATVKVAQIGDRLGVILTDHLRDSFNPNGVDVLPQYQLTVALSETQNGIATREDGTAAWVDVFLKADWTLKRLKDGKVVTSGTSSATAGAGQLEDNYANIVSQQADEKRDLDQLQADIQTRVALSLKDGATAS